MQQIFERVRKKKPTTNQSCKLLDFFCLRTLSIYFICGDNFFLRILTWSLASTFQHISHTRSIYNQFEFYMFISFFYSCYRFTGTVLCVRDKWRLFFSHSCLWQWFRLPFDLMYTVGILVFLVFSIETRFLFIAWHLNLMATTLHRQITMSSTSPRARCAFTLFLFCFFFRFEWNIIK